MWFLEKVDLISGSPRDPPGPVAGAGASQGAPPQALVALRPLDRSRHTSHRPACPLATPAPRCLSVSYSKVRCLSLLYSCRLQMCWWGVRTLGTDWGWAAAEPSASIPAVLLYLSLPYALPLTSCLSSFFI